MTEVLAVVARRVVPTAVDIASHAVADARCRSVGAIPDSRATLALDVVNDVGHELLAVHAVADREPLALTGALAGPPCDGVAASLTQTRHVERPPGPTRPAVDGPGECCLARQHRLARWEPHDLDRVPMGVGRGLDEQQLARVRLVADVIEQHLHLRDASTPTPVESRPEQILVVDVSRRGLTFWRAELGLLRLAHRSRRGRRRGARLHVLSPHGRRQLHGTLPRQVDRRLRRRQRVPRHRLDSGRHPVRGRDQRSVGGRRRRRGPDRLDVGRADRRVERLREDGDRARAAVGDTGHPGAHRGHTVPDF